MEKQNLYWHIQQLDYIGGTEMVSIDLMNHLVNEFNITCIVTSEINKSKYTLDPKIKVYSLNIPLSVVRLDVSFLENKKNKQPYKNISLICKMIHHFVFKNFSYKKQIKKLINKNPGKLISSAADSYLLAPKGIYSIFHFHFNTRNYFSFTNRLLLSLSRRPNHIVFLTKSTMDIVSEKKRLKSTYSFIYNPIRIEPKKNYEFHNNSICFIGRLSEQKNPQFAIEIAKSLVKMNFNFNLNIAGEGPLENRVKELIEQYNLSKNVNLLGGTTDIEKLLGNSDLLLITSRFEGFVLVKGEANAMSVPVISTNFGDSIFEMFDNGKDGYFLGSENPDEYAKLIIKILKDREGLIKLKESSFEKSKELSHNKIIPQWIRLLRS